MADPEVLPPGQFDWSQYQPRPKFQHNYRVHLIFFALALFTTTTREALVVFWEALFSLQPQYAFSGFIWPVIREGLWYSIPALTILAAHEFGHYVMCRVYDVDATLPYFLPFPLPPTGTLGAVIKIKAPFPSKKALFDIGIGGPIAGFFALIPFLYFGLKWSHLAPVPAGEDIAIYGDPLLLKLLAHWRFGAYPPGMDLFIHPMAFAAWFGMLATALNLFPFGQLDGGHISYAVFGRRASYVSMATLAITVLLTLKAGSWIVTSMMMLAMAFFIGVGHPRLYDEDTPLDPGRKLLAAFAVVMFILCFTPVPVTILGK